MSVVPVRPTTLAELRALEGRELGPTEWLELSQQEIDAFAQVTGDFQWIHVDREQAAGSAFGSTIAHGLLVLGLGPAFTAQLMAYDGFAHSLNYGYEKVRFPSPLPVDSRIRMRLRVADVREVAGGAHVITIQTFEREGQDKPVCVAHAASRFMTG